MSTYAVGDIQGCFKPLKKLLKKVGFSCNTDTLWVAGDMVNRGPNSLETLQFIRDLGDAAIPVLGNHDLHLLAVAESSASVRPKDTLNEVLDHPKANKLLKWLRHQPLIHHDSDLGYTMVHAGIPPIWTIKDALNYAEEVHCVLRSKKRSMFFENMYGNSPDIWNPKLKGMPRLRLITNYLTRMRYCNKKGHLELNTKTNPKTPPKSYAPWFKHKHHRCKNERIIFGHWASLMGETHKANIIGLDTGCVWGGCLTMIRLEDGKYFHVNC